MKNRFYLIIFFLVLAVLKISAQITGLTEDGGKEEIPVNIP